MSDRKRAGNISELLAPSSRPRSSPGVAAQSEEERRGLVGKVSEQITRTLNNGDKDELTLPVRANHNYVSSEPSLEDMEDTCSEYDNVGSDVEQDCDEVLHLNREGVMDAKYYKQFCSGEGGYITHAVGDNINESSHAAEQYAVEPRQSAEICEGSQAGTKPFKKSHRFKPHCASVAGNETERGMEKGQETRFFSDGDEIEEVLDGAEFIKDLDETESCVLRQTGLYQNNENERLRKGGDDTRVARHHNIPGGSKKQGKGRGRRGVGEDLECVVPGIKGCPTSNAEQHPKTSSKDSKKVSARSKARSGSSKQHAPPRHAHAQSPANAQNAQPHGETAPVPKARPSSAMSQEREPSVVKPSLAHHCTLEQQKQPLEEAQGQLDKAQQVNNTNRTGWFWIAQSCSTAYQIELYVTMYKVLKSNTRVKVKI